MGLKNFTAIFKSPKLGLKRDFDREGWLSDYKGKRLAIDAPLWMRSFMATSQKTVSQHTSVIEGPPDRSEVLKLWLSRALEYIKTFLSLGITPVFVFDGTAVPDKNDTREKRQEAKEKVENEIIYLEEEQKRYDILMVPEEITIRLRDLYSQQSFISREEIEVLMTALQGIGIPVIQATGEAEQLCSLLSIEGICEAVISKDRDCYAFGCPYLITDISPTRWNNGVRDRSITRSALADILSTIDMSFETFVDFCIMSGCDFNTNIYKVGGVKCYEYLKECKSLNNLPESFTSKHSLAPLNIERCREIFKVVSWKERYISGAFDLPEKTSPFLREVFESIGCGEKTSEFSDLIKDCPKPHDRGYSLLPNRKRFNVNLIKN